MATAPVSSVLFVQFPSMFESSIEYDTSQQISMGISGYDVTFLNKDGHNISVFRAIEPFCVFS
jgi:hypothetical protein